MMKTKWINFYIRTVISFLIYYLLNLYINYNFCLNIYISLNDQIVAIFEEIKHYKENPFKGGEINGELRPYQLEGIKWLDVFHGQYPCDNGHLNQMYDNLFGI